MAAVWSIYSIITIIHNGNCPQKFTRQLDTAESALWSICSDAGSNTEHMPLS